MRLTYDAEADAAYLYVVDSIGFGEASDTRVTDVHLEGASIIVDLDDRQRLLGVEILGASRVLRRETLESAEPQR